jgi:hypothetical protein
MSRTYRGEERKIRVRGIRRKADARRLARALIELEYLNAKTEAEAEAEHDKQPKPGRRRNQR